MPDALTLIIAALAVYRVSRMVTDEEGPFALFSRIRDRFPPTNWVGRGLECVLCVSFWAALPVAWWLGGPWGLTWPALSAVTVIIRKWEQKR